MVLGLRRRRIRPRDGDPPPPPPDAAVGEEGGDDGPAADPAPAPGRSAGRGPDGGVGVGVGVGVVDRPFRVGEALGMAAVAAAAAAAYLPPIPAADFAWDDLVFAESNSHLLGPGALSDIWWSPGTISGTPASGVRHRPALFTFLWLQHRMWRLRAPYYRAASLAVHASNAWMVRRVVRRAGGGDSASWLSAAIFALHPTRVESVAWIASQGEVASGSLYLTALLMHPSTRATAFEPGIAAQFSTAASLVLYGLGMLTESRAVVALPAALLLMPYAMRGRVRWCEVEHALPFAAIGLVVSIWEAARVRGADSFDLGLSVWGRAQIAVRAVGFYVAKLLWPSDLVMIYPRWDVRREGGAFVLCLAAELAAFCALLAMRRRSRRWGRWPLTAAVLFVATLGPRLGLANCGYMQYSYVADRYQYLAGVAPMALLATAVTKFVSHKGPIARRIAVLVVGTYLLVLGSLTRSQTRHYRNLESFFGHVVRLNPRGLPGWWHLGTDVYFHRRDYRLAADCYEKVLDIIAEESEGPESQISRVYGAKVRINYGIALNNLKRYEESVVHLGEALALSPNSTRVLNELGNAMSSLGRHDEAAKYHRRALTLDPAYAIGWFNLGSDLGRAGRYEEALGPLERAIALNSAYWKARVNLSIMLNNLGHRAEAMEQVHEVLARDPRNRLARELLDEALGRAKLRAPSQNNSNKPKTM